MFALSASILDNHNHVCPDALANGHVGMRGVMVSKQEGCHPVVVVPRLVDGDPSLIYIDMQRHNHKWLQYPASRRYRQHAEPRVENI